MLRAPRPIRMSIRRPSLADDDSVPLYIRIRDTLRAGILDGSHPPHSQMPSESELQDRFGVSRITIRQALSHLEREGLIFKRHGKGSFVSQPKAFQNVTALEGFAEAMSRMGHEIVNRVVSFDFVPARADVAHRLDLEPGTTVTEIHRVRLLNRAPVSYEITFLPESLGRQLQRADLITRDVFLILENDCAVPLGSADLGIDAVLADRPLARALEIGEGAPLLRIERLTHDRSGRPVDFEFLYFRSDTFQYRLRIDRQSTRKPR
ncbi:HTH-type transcriptional repressor NagR [Cupriavidus numazuensis]|uniref:HTH-type transcriptional repressor NagR n=2 Tax=Cupriavidus numazuensis TaxID=221992 RepID=A0ABM8TQP6_9BURK|nr:HTH-type transcriptional repressor NagR [Cupriavidus numazuensis]